MCNVSANISNPQPSTYQNMPLHQLVAMLYKLAHKIIIKNENTCVSFLTLLTPELTFSDMLHFSSTKIHVRVPQRHVHNGNNMMM